MQKVYYMSNRYPEERCIINKCPDCYYSNIQQDGKIKKWGDKILQGIAHRYSYFKGEKTLSVYTYLQRRGIIHVFNICIKSKMPWICTFESIVPRTNCTRKRDWKKIDNLTYNSVKLLTQNNCVQCLALSEATYKLQMDFLMALRGRVSEKDIEKIRNKTKVLHPPQPVILQEDEIKEKFLKNKKEFIFVGHDFFRKGGKEMLEVLKELKQKYDFHLTIVSRLEYNDYASKATQGEKETSLAFIKNCDWITYYEEMDNEQVIQLCKQMHIGLLPTFADTYGYSVLEMQACGCTMVTTDIRALPEINNTECGYICHLPQDEFGEAYYQTEEQRLKMKYILKTELKRELTAVVEASMNELCDKAIKSMKRIAEKHDPQEYGASIKKIIDQI